MRIFLNNNITFVRGLISVVVVMGFWEAAFRLFSISTLLLAPPSAIFKAWLELIASGEYAVDFFYSLQEFIIGFGMAAGVAIPLGLIIGVNKTVRDYCEPWISAIYTTPTVALAPLFIVAFGIGIYSKVAMVFLVSFFPIVVNTNAGVASVNREFMEVAHSFGATRWQVFVKILIPAVLPFIVAGLRLGLGRGLMGVVIGEMFGARDGMGYLIIESTELFDIPSVFVGVITFMLLGIAGTELLKFVERKLAPWRSTYKSH